MKLTLLFSAIFVQYQYYCKAQTKQEKKAEFYVTEYKDFSEMKSAER